VGENWRWRDPNVLLPAGLGEKIRLRGDMVTIKGYRAGTVPSCVCTTVTSRMAGDIRRAGVLAQSGYDSGQ